MPGDATLQSDRETIPGQEHNKGHRESCKTRKVLFPKKFFLLCNRGSTRFPAFDSLFPQRPSPWISIRSPAQEPTWTATKIDSHLHSRLQQDLDRFLAEGGSRRNKLPR